jgi:hypothetical protein
MLLAKWVWRLKHERTKGRKHEKGEEPSFRHFLLSEFANNIQIGGKVNIRTRAIPIPLQEGINRKSTRYQEGINRERPRRQDF